jgi:hypothetical protein
MDGMKDDGKKEMSQDETAVMSALILKSNNCSSRTVYTEVSLFLGDIAAEDQRRSNSLAADPWIWSCTVHQNG